MELHWDKFQLLELRCRASIYNPAGEWIVPKSRIDYLGSLLSFDGLPGNLHEELAWPKPVSFNCKRVWKHSALRWIQ